MQIQATRVFLQNVVNKTSVKRVDRGRIDLHQLRGGHHALKGVPRVARKGTHDGLSEKTIQGRP